MRRIQCTSSQSQMARRWLFAPLSLITLLLLAVSLTPRLDAAERTADGVLRWRVLADQESRISFRIPFTYDIPDMYHPGVTRERRGRRATVTGEEAAGLTPDQIRALLQQRLRNPETSRVDYDIELFFRPQADLGPLAQAELGAAAEAISGVSGLSWQAFDYYDLSDSRPQATANWAPRGITAQLGISGTHSALALRYAQGIAVVVCTGNLDAHNNRHILDTVEVMVEQRRQLHTFRHGTAARGMVIDHSGAIIRPPNAENSRINEAWAIETANYHIISNVSPRHLQQYASMMEVLYDAYHRTYMPDRMPPFKMEVAVWSSQGEMVRAAGAIGIGPIPPTVLGFFSPTLLNIMAYETGPRRDNFNTFATLAHEASHQFLHVACNGSAHVPTWINEGLAVYFESSSYNNGRLNIEIPRERVALLRRIYPRNNNRMLWPPDRYLNHYGHIPGENYGEVYLKTHFWIFGVRNGRERFQRYWRALLAGEDGTEAFERIFMADLIQRYGSRAAALREVENAVVNHLGNLR
ncbi:MAG: DUF1570 domain-containing protein [Planctomycetota bacterium]|nr:MAG: DUF1570 domain-containing protein [Planctomycetota bacterium]